MTARMIARLGLLIGLAALPAACSPTGGTGTPGGEATPVEQVGQLLRSFHEQNKPSPKSLKDAEKMGTALPKALEALRSGDVVIYWGVNLDEYGGASLIGYEKQVPEKGGVIILGGGTTPEVTAEVFRTIPKPPESRLKPAGPR